MIRHAGLGPPLAIAALAIAVSPSAGLRALIPTVGCASLVLPRFQPARFAAVALSTVAMAAHEKQSPTAGGRANPWTEESFRYNRHRFDSAFATIHRMRRRWDR